MGKSLLICFLLLMQKKKGKTQDLRMDLCLKVDGEGTGTQQLSHSGLQDPAVSADPRQG